MSHYGHLFILVAALFSGSCALYEDCEKPPTVPHASVQTTDDDDSVFAVYTCADGYELSGIAELVCNLDTDEWNSDPPSCLSVSEISNEVDPERASEPTHKKKPQNVPENPRVSPQMAATLDMSCVQAKVKAPEIRYGFVQNYDRRRSGDHLYLVAFYACNDRFEFEDPEITEVYCSQRQWVGELPACITLGEYEEGDEEEYEEYEVVEGGGEEHPHVVPPQPAQPIPPSEPMPPVQSVSAEVETKELSNEVTAENSIPHEDTPHSTETKDTGEKRTPEKPVTDVNIVVEPTRDPYTPRLLDHECGSENGGCEHKCERLLFPGENEPRLKCSCFEGFSLDPYDYARCHDIDECLANNGGCEQICNNLPGSFECACEAGLQIDTLTGHTCVDINECESPEISQLCPEGCENTVGSFRCIETLNSKEDALEAEAVDERERATEKAAPATCPPGFGVSQGGACEDIDECATGVSGCDHCRNTEGGFECICPPGFELDEDDRTCIDVNECDIIVEEDVNVGPSKLCAYGCQNTPGSFHCTCAADAHLLDDGRTCVADTCADLSNAALGKTRCTYQCEDLPHGGYACTCPAGYRLGSDARSCELVEDACATKGGYELCAPGTCNSTADNTSYICNCPPGYFAEASACRDIDECSSGTHSCSHVCINSAGGYQCSCPDGYRLSAGSWEKCEDVDECQSQTNLCGNLICLNVPGGFMCVCPDGSDPNSQGRCEVVSADPCAKENGGCSHMCMSESHGATCGCPNGMRLADDGRNCFYEDLCAENNGGCEQLCAQGTCGCRDGFLLREDGKSCRDFDECSISNGDCQQECRNYEGSYECACQAGFRLADDRRTCIDTDECALGSHGCSHDCVNLAGGYECTCPQGYVLGEDKAMCLEVSAAPAECAAGSMLVAGEGCVPLSSCLSNNGGCSHTCDDVLGCTCPVGLELAVDDKTCVDVDECLLNNGGCSSICVNTFGSYQCACRDGATLTDGRSCPAVCPLGFRNSPVDATVCEDIDECATPGTCQFGCLNLNGSYTCICPPGYALRDGRECEDIDECLSDNGGCRNGGECVNLEGSYVCRCPADSILGADRHTCEPRDKCSELAAPPNGDVHCTKYRHKTELFYNTKCKVWCNRGYRLQGPTHRYCDANGIWDTQENECTPIVCPRIPQPSNGVIVPATCSSGKTFLGERCRLRCHPGHVPIGKTVAVCTASQLWSTNTTLDCVRTRDSSPWHTTAATANRRLSPPPALPEPPSILPASHNRKPLLPPDFATTLTHLPPVATTTPAPTQPPLGLQPTDIGIRRPYIKCPRNTTVFLSSGEPTAHIILQRPVTNLDFRYIESQPAWARDLQAHLGPGSYVITFRGHDPATGRSARCQTVINVRRAEAPRVEFCPESFEVTLRENQAYRSVFWKEPRFEGDLGRRLKKMYKSRIPGELFGAGVHTIYYEATNEEGLTARCEFQITVKAPAKTPVVGYGFLPSSAQTTHGFSPATQTAHGFHAGVQTSRGFSQSSQTSHGFSQSSQTSHGFKLVETSRGFNQASHTSHGFDHASRTTHTLQPYANYAESYTVPRESARLLPGHESYIFCPGQAAIRVADEQPVNLPADCTLKNVRVHPSRHHLQGRTLSSLWKPFTKF